jgi:segregation and condensation protein B
MVNPMQRDEDFEPDLEKLARMYADDFEMEELAVPDSSSKEVSLEELGQAFARVIGASPSSDESPQAEAADSSVSLSQDPAVIDFPSESTKFSGAAVSVDSNPPPPEGDDDQFPVTPLSILEAVLLIGRPDSGSITATEIAALMRGVSECEVDYWVDQLNADYIANHRALRIAKVEGGFRMQLAEDLENIRQSFLGPSRPVKLSQAAIDCMSLVSYQPGISRELLDEQLGKSSGAILNQLVRRQLLEIRRAKDPIAKKIVARYYPTQRLLDLVGLESLDDLPTAEEWVDRV